MIQFGKWIPSLFRNGS